MLVLYIYMLGKHVQSLILILIILFIFIWTSSPTLSHYNLQLTGALILVYFGSKYVLRLVTADNLFFTTITLVSITLLLIFSSGGISSPIFFILDFLLFAIALLITPLHAVIVSISLISIFVWQNFYNVTSSMIIELISLAFVTPLAVIFGKIYLTSLHSKGKINLLKEAVKDEQADSLLWITTTAKPSLASVLNSLTDLVVYLNTKSQAVSIPKALIEKLKTIQRDLITLYASTGSLEKSIEDSSDKMEL